MGRQAIHIAAATGNIAVLKLLVETYKVPVNVVDKVCKSYMYLLLSYITVLSMICTVTIFIGTYAFTYYVGWSSTYTHSCSKQSYRNYRILSKGA